MGHESKQLRELFLEFLEALNRELPPGNDYHDRFLKIARENPELTLDQVYDIMENRS